MRRLRRAAWLALVLLGGAPAAAGEHLEPVRTGSYPGYQDLVRAALAEAFAPQVRIRAIVYPSFEREYAVALAETRGRHTLVVLEARARFWEYATVDMMNEGKMDPFYLDMRRERVDSRVEILAKLPPRAEAMRPARCEAPLPRTLARRTVAVWRAMLEGPRDRPTMGLDGVTYVYSMEADGRSLSGSTWSPDPKGATRASLLVDITHALRDYCRARNTAGLRDLDRLTADLLARAD